MAEAGDSTAVRTAMLVAHHDAAHSGLVFHPALGRLPTRLTPRLHERAGQSLPILYAVWLGPVLICAGTALGRGRLRRAGLALAVGAGLAMADIGSRAVVPGANDNLAAVGVLIAVAQALRERPLQGLRVLLVSTGSEESFSEGMQAFGRRHFGSLDPTRIEIVCLECLGGPTLIVLEGEGMLRMRDYPAAMRDARCAGRRRRSRRREGLTWTADGSGDRCGDRAAGRVPGRHPGLRRPHEAPAQLPLAVGPARGAALGDDRGRDRGVRAVPPLARGSALSDRQR